MTVLRPAKHKLLVVVGHFGDALPSVTSKKHKKLKPGSVTCQELWPGNDEGPTLTAPRVHKGLKHKEIWNQTYTKIVWAYDGSLSDTVAAFLSAWYCSVSFDWDQLIYQSLFRSVIIEPVLKQPELPPFSRLGSADLPIFYILVCKYNKKIYNSQNTK